MGKKVLCVAHLNGFKAETLTEIYTSNDLKPFFVCIFYFVFGSICVFQLFGHCTCYMATTIMCCLTFETSRHIYWLATASREKFCLYIFDFSFVALSIYTSMLCIHFITYIFERPFEQTIESMKFWSEHVTSICHLNSYNYHCNGYNIL